MKTTKVQKQSLESQAVSQAKNQTGRVMKDNRAEAVAQRKLMKTIQAVSDEEEEELIQGKLIQKAGMEEEEEELMQNKAITQRAENKTGMPNRLKSGIESLSGLDMSDVKVHYNSAKPASVQAHAYTQGSDIHVAPGQEKHLGHEAWHVAQQKQGRVMATTEIGGMPVNDSPSLEKEADVMGAKANSLK